MAKRPTTPIKITAHVADGRINSINGIIMLDSILYHAWFQKHAPHVLEGMGSGSYDGHVGLPLRQLPGNRWAASRGVFDELSRTVEYINRRPNFFDADKLGHLGMDKGMISSSVGPFRAYRMPNVIHTVRDGLVTFWAVGHKEQVLEMLNSVISVGKKYAAGYGVIDEWKVEDCDDDYSLWHPKYGLMRPVEVESDEARELDLKGYPIMKWAVKPPYWKKENERLCFVPIGERA